MVYGSLIILSIYVFFVFQGGGFRDSLSEISDELCPQDVGINKTLPLFIKSVNNRVSLDIF